MLDNSISVAIFLDSVEYMSASYVCVEKALAATCIGRAQHLIRLGVGRFDRK